MKGGIYLIATRKGTVAKIGQTGQTFDDRLEQNRKSGRLKPGDKVEVVGMNSEKRDRVEAWAINKFEPIRSQRAPKIQIAQSSYLWCRTTRSARESWRPSENGNDEPVVSLVWRNHTPP